jgi:hypothetical protein
MTLTTDTHHTGSLPSGLRQPTRDDGPGATQSDISVSRLQQLACENYPGAPHSYEPSGPSTSGLQQLAREKSPVAIRGPDYRSGRYDHQFDGPSYKSEISREVIPDEQRYNNDVSTSRVTTDPYQTQRSQSPIRRRPRSPGSGFSTTTVQSPDPRQPTARRDRNDTLPDHRVGHEVHIGSDNSSQYNQLPPSPDCTSRNAKRDNDGAGLDLSWMMQQPDNAVTDVTHMLRGRKEHRTNDGLMRDDLRSQSPQRRNVTHDWGLPEARRNNEPVGPRFESNRQRFGDQEEKEQRMRRRET